MVVSLKKVAQMKKTIKVGAYKAKLQGNYYLICWDKFSYAMVYINKVLSECYDTPMSELPDLTQLITKCQKEFEHETTH